MTRTLMTIAVLFATLTAVAPGTNAADDTAKWKQAVVQKLVKNQRYPRSAVSRGIEGKAVVELTVAPDGTIKSHQINQPTGAKVLDREIAKLVTRMNPLPALPGAEGDVSFELPIVWRLN